MKINNLFLSPSGIGVAWGQYRRAVTDVSASAVWMVMRSNFPIRGYEGILAEGLNRTPRKGGLS